MKKLLIIAALAYGVWHFWHGNGGTEPGAGARPIGGEYEDVLPPAPKTRESSGIMSVEFEPMLYAEQGFADLAQPGYYTIVEVYLDTCAICKHLETSYPQFLEMRRDVLVRKVHFPEGGMQLKIEGNTREEMQAQADALNAQIASYDVCGTPHIEVYGPDGTLLARDACGEKHGLAYLRHWIGDELGRDPSTI